MLGMQITVTVLIAYNYNNYHLLATIFIIYLI